jgi:dTDP-4-dehydrorhamnose reductase
MSRRVMIVGHRGQLGQDLIKQFAEDELLLMTQQEINVTDEAQTSQVVSAAKPNLILNCAAYHLVDDCEEKAELAMSVNAFGAMYLARAAKCVDASLVHYSTDYVYGGTSRTPHPETEAIEPRCIYGASKAAGEGLVLSTWRKSFVVRTCGLYGYAGSREKGTNFVEFMIGKAKQGGPLKIVNDQTCTPTATRDLAEATKHLVSTDAFGLYHLTNDGECTWFEFAQEFFRWNNLHPPTTPVPSTEFPQKATRPSYSVLQNAKYDALGLPKMQHWKEAIARYCAGRAANGRA